MRSFKPTSLLATLTAGLLMLAMVLGALAGNTVVVRFEHSHEEGHHHHDDHHDESGHEHAPHDDHSPDDDHHHHHLTIPVSPAIFVPDTCVRISVFFIRDFPGFPYSPSCPDEPCFELIKPPQIG